MLQPDILDSFWSSKVKAVSRLRSFEREPTIHQKDGRTQQPFLFYNQAAMSTWPTSAMMSWCSNWETRCWQRHETKLTNCKVQVDWINYIQHMQIQKQTRFDTAQDVAHGMSGILGFRAGLWLSCFPGRVGDDMELWGMYRAARQQPGHSQAELRVCVCAYVSVRRIKDKLASRLAACWGLLHI